MNHFLCNYTKQRTEEIHKFSQSASKKEVTLAESLKVFDSNKKFLNVLKFLFELKKIPHQVLLKEKELTDITEIEMNTLFENLTTSRDTKSDNFIVLAITYYYMGAIYTRDLDNFQYLSIAEGHYMRCIKLLKEKELERKAILTVMKVYNELSIIKFTSLQPEEGYLLLDTALELYLKYTKEEIDYPDPIDLVAILAPNIETIENPKALLERFYLNILNSLTNTYINYSKNKHRFVIHVHNILSKRIEETIISSGENMILWATTSLELSCYFLCNHLFTEARNYIAAAEYMSKIFEDMLMIKDQEDSIYSHLCQLHKILCAYITRTWAAYGVQLLLESKEKLIQKEEGDISCETDNLKSESVIKSKEDLKLLICIDSEKDLEIARFTDKYVSNLNDAKKIFVEVLKQYNAANQLFFAKNVDFFFEKTILTSMAYKYLASFYQNKNEQIKLITCQIDILEKALLYLKKTKLQSSLKECNMLSIYKELTNAYNNLVTLKDH